MISKTDLRCACRAFAHFSPCLRGQTIYTEAATGVYALLPAYAVRAGARVVLVSRDSAHGTRRAALAQVRDVFRRLRLDYRNHVVVEGPANRARMLAKCTVALNTGHTRPYDRQKLNLLAGLKGIALMRESWEQRPGEIDYRVARKRGVAVIGTNECHSYLNTFAWMARAALRRIRELGIDPERDALILYGSSPLTRPLAGAITAAGGRVWNCVRLDRQLTLPRCRAVVMMNFHDRRMMFSAARGEWTVRELLRQNPALQFIHICGGIARDDRRRLRRQGGLSWKKFGAMTVDAAYGNNRPAIDLMIAGLKVAETIVSGRDRCGIRYHA